MKEAGGQGSKEVEEAGGSKPGVRRKGGKRTEGGVAPKILFSAGLEPARIPLLNCTVYAKAVHVYCRENIYI